MAQIATDSARDLKKLVGSDSTATMEDDPTFVDSNPTANASTENVTVQQDTDDDLEDEVDEDEDLAPDDDDEGDVDEEVDEDALVDDDVDTEQVAEPIAS